MESGNISVSAAADVATLPKEEQTEVVARCKVSFPPRANEALKGITGKRLTYRRIGEALV